MITFTLHLHYKLMLTGQYFLRMYGYYNSLTTLSCRGERSTPGDRQLTAPNTMHFRMFLFCCFKYSVP